MHFTKEQIEVIEHSGGHAKVVAVAGAGKTTTLVQRVIRLLECGANPRLIRVIMYNKSAQLDFEAKLGRAAAGHFTSLPEVRTFHAMGLKLYRSLVAEGYLPSFKAEPLSERRLSFQLLNILKSLASSQTQSDIKSNPKYWVSALGSFIDIVKSGMSSPQSVFERINADASTAFFVDAFHYFEEWRKQHDVITFSDMLYEPVMFFQKNPHVAHRYINLVDHFLVDEYQDINEIQHYLLTLLAGTRAEVMVIGDPDQTIYEFRGSRPEYMLSIFDQDFPRSVSYPLSHTFRYGDKLALLANSLISHNQGREEVLCVSHPGTPRTEIDLHFQSDYENAVVATIQAELEEGTSPGDIAVLCRTWAIAAPIELTLLSAGIHYRIDGGAPALKRPEAQALITLLEHIEGRLSAEPQVAQVDRWLGLLRACGLRVKAEVLEQAAVALSKGTFAHFLGQQYAWSEKQLGLVQLGLEQARRYPEQASEAVRVFDRIAGLAAGLSETALTGEDADERSSVLKAFINFICKQGDQRISAVLNTFAQLQKSLDDASHDDANALVRITSIHKSKGWEWPVVLIPGVTDKHMPYQPTRELVPTPGDIESERRLLYVGMTRAQRILHLFAPGVEGISECDCPASGEEWLPSRFLAEMDLGTIDRLGQALYDGTETLTMEVPLPPVANEYLLATGSGLQINEPPSDSGAVAGDAVGTPVRDSLYGVGIISGQTPLFYTVDFGRSIAYILRVTARTRLAPVTAAQYEEATGRKARVEPRPNPPSGSGRTVFKLNEPIEHRVFGLGSVQRATNTELVVDFGPKEGVRRLSRKTLNNFLV